MIEGISNILCIFSLIDQESLVQLTSECFSPPAELGGCLQQTLASWVQGALRYSPTQEDSCIAQPFQAQWGPAQKSIIQYSPSASLSARHWGHLPLTLLPQIPVLGGGGSSDSTQGWHRLENAGGGHIFPNHLLPCTVWLSRAISLFCMCMYAVHVCMCVHVSVLLGSMHGHVAPPFSPFPHPHSLCILHCLSARNNSPGNPKHPSRAFCQLRMARSHLGL